METCKSMQLPRFESAERLFLESSNKIPKEGLITQVVQPQSERFPAINEQLETKDDEEVEIQKSKWLRKLVSEELHGKGYGVPGRGRRAISQNVTGTRKESITTQDAVVPKPPTTTRRNNSLLISRENTGFQSSADIRSSIGKPKSRRVSKLYASNPLLNSKSRKTSVSLGRRDSTFTSLPSQIDLRSLNLTMKELESIRTREARKEKGMQPKIIISDNLLGGKNDVEIDDQDKNEEDVIEKDEAYLENERRAGNQVEEDWLLEEKLKEEMRKFERLSNKLSIKRPDEDTMEAIERRMKEVRIMTRPKRDTRPVIERLDPVLRDRILKIDKLHINDMKREKRKKWKLRDLFMWSVQMVRFLLRCFRNRKKYYVDASDMAQLRRRMEKEIQQSQNLTPVSKSSCGLTLPADLRIALTTSPELRGKKDLQQVLWLLRTTRAFKTLFPAEMEEKLARHVAYEKYDDGRILACQGRAPDRFYYIVAGRANILRQYQLSTGHVTKSMRYLSKGMMTDPEEMEKQWFREDSIIAKGQVEVLLIDKEAFKILLTSHQGPPVDFLKAIDLFEEFLPEHFLDNTDAIEYKYYGQGKMVLKDSNRTNWLHVVKSGAVKVVRRQMVVDSVPSNVKKMSSRRQDGLGTARNSSHASAMQGVQAKQKKFTELKKKQKTLSKRRAAQRLKTILDTENENLEEDTPSKYNDTRLPSSDQHLPDIHNGNMPSSRGRSSKSVHSASSKRPFSGVVTNPYIQECRSGYAKSPFPDTIGVDDVDISDDSFYMPSIHATPAPLIYRGSASSKKSYSTVPSATLRKSAHFAKEKNVTIDLSDGSESDDNQDEDAFDEIALDRLNSVSRGTTREKKRKRSGTKLPAINIPMRSVTSMVSAYEPHNLWLTRERTDNDADMEIEIYNKLFPKKKADTFYRRAYLQLDVLKAGDVFGLDHLQQTLASEPQGFSLLSDGAEIVKVSKRFFNQYASNNTMMKVELMYKKYLTEEEAKESLYLKETWQQYRGALWDRITESMEPPAPYTVR